MRKIIWKPVVGFEKHYEVSNIGEVRRTGVAGGALVGHIRVARVGTTGYYHLNLSKDGLLGQRAIHRMVAQAFIPNTLNLPQVNHKNGVKTDNRVENLEWCTNQENLLHANRTGLVNRKGQNNGRSKLSSESVINIWHCKGSVSARRLAELYDLHVSYIYAIWEKKFWRHLWKETPNA